MTPYEFLIVDVHIFTWLRLNDKLCVCLCRSFNVILDNLKYFLNIFQLIENINKQSGFSYPVVFFWTIITFHCTDLRILQLQWVHKIPKFMQHSQNVLFCLLEFLSQFISLIIVFVTLLETAIQFLQNIFIFYQEASNLIMRKKQK